MYNGFSRDKFGRHRNIYIEDNTIILVSKDGTERIKNLPYTYDSFVDTIENMGYYQLYSDKTEYYDENLERHTMPPIASVFYGYMWKYERIPTFDELFDAYVKMYVDKGEKWSFNSKYHEGYFEFDKNALKGGIWRAYYSFIREFDLYLYLSRNLHAIYDFQTDYFGGSDIIVENGNRTIYIASLLRTKRSSEYKYKKNTYRHEYDEPNTIEAWLDMSNPYQSWNCNGVYLYTSEYMDEIYRKCVK